MSIFMNSGHLWRIYRRYEESADAYLRQRSWFYRPQGGSLPPLCAFDHSMIFHGTGLAQCGSKYGLVENTVAQMSVLASDLTVNGPATPHVNSGEHKRWQEVKIWGCDQMSSNSVHTSRQSPPLSPGTSAACFLTVAELSLPEGQICLLQKFRMIFGWCCQNHWFWGSRFRGLFRSEWGQKVVFETSSFSQKNHYCLQISVYAIIRATFFPWNARIGNMSVADHSGP